jgi:hypothetical protein
MKSRRSSPAALTYSSPELAHTGAVCPEPSTARSAHTNPVSLQQGRQVFNWDLNKRSLAGGNQHRQWRALGRDKQKVSDWSLPLQSEKMVNPIPIGAQTKEG